MVGMLPLSRDILKPMLRNLIKPYGSAATFSLNLLTDSLPSSITFTRASAATDIVSGVLTSYSSDQPRISTANGFLIEGLRTNSNPNSGTSGAVVGVVGSGGAYPTNWLAVNTRNLAQEIVSVRTENGFRITRLKISGTPNSTGALGLQYTANTAITASSSQVWTTSQYVALVGGSLTNVTSIETRVNEGTSGGSYLNGSGTTFTPTSTLTRYSHTRTLGGSSARVWGGMDITVTNGLAVDLTLDISEPQVEQGSYPSSVIQTTSAAVTRAADSAIIDSTNFSSWYNDTEGTIVAGFNVPITNVTANRAVFSVNDTTTSNRTYAFINTSSNVTCTISSGGSNVYTPGGVAAVFASTKKVAVGYKLDNMRGAFNNTLMGLDTSGAMPVTPTRLCIGGNHAATGESLFGYLREFSYYNTRKSDSEIQALTA